MKLELVPEKLNQRPERNEKRHVVVEASEKDTRKLDSFVIVMKDVAEDMGLKAYLDTTNYLIGKDY